MSEYVGSAAGWHATLDVRSDVPGSTCRPRGPATNVAADRPDATFKIIP
ncbi:hypothetical protein [Micromonospora luteifusca]